MGARAGMLGLLHVAPSRIIGLRRPNVYEGDRSKLPPIVGPMNAPERGMEIIMVAVADFERLSVWR